MLVCSARVVEAKSLDNERQEQNVVDAAFDDGGNKMTPTPLDKFRHVVGDVIRMNNVIGVMQRSAKTMVNGWKDIPLGGEYAEEDLLTELKQVSFELSNALHPTSLPEDFSRLELMGVQEQKVKGRNFKVCLRTPESKHFQVTFHVALGATKIDTTSSNLIDLEGLSLPYRHEEFKYACSKRKHSDGDDESRSPKGLDEEEHHVPENDEVLPVSSSSILPSANTRYLRKETKVWSGETMGVDPPASFDWRDELGGRCRAQIEQIYDQGQCGACYAHAATSALADRVCVAAAKKGKRLSGPLRFSAQDVLGCGSKQHGALCESVQTGAGTVTITRFARNCDGGLPLKVYEYASVHGLKEEECDPFDLNGDAVKPTDINFGQDVRCAIVTTPGFSGGEVGCDARYYTVNDPSDRTNLNRLEFCKCPNSDRWFETADGHRVSEWPESQFSVMEMYSDGARCVVKPKPGKRPTKNTKIGCDTRELETPGIFFTPFDSVVEAITSRTAVSLGKIIEIGDGNREFRTDAGHICRCAEEDRTDEGWELFDVSEQGQGALRRECQRKKMTGGCARKTYAFSDPTEVANGEEAMKRAIMYGGPITVGFDTYGNELERYSDNGGRSVYRGQPSGASPRSGGHAIVIFGWGTTERGEAFWWARNTWGDEWPHDAQAPGIFKFARGEDRSRIEQDASFGLVKTIPDVSGVRSPFPGGTEKCAAFAKRGEALDCLRVTLGSDSTTIENTCRDKTVRVTEMTSNVVASKEDRSQCGRGYSTYTLSPGRVSTLNMFVNVCPLEAVIHNQCDDDLKLSFIGRRVETEITSPVRAGEITSVDHIYCSQEMRTAALRSGSDVDRTRCCKKSPVEKCEIRNTCNRQRMLQRIVGRMIYTMEVPATKRDDDPGVLVNDDWCDPGASISVED
eukprot:g1011.t1